ncbi:hypothetical protein D9M71_813180 [compost metagenome]
MADAAGAAAVGQGVQPIEPWGVGAGLGLGDARQAHQRLVHFIHTAGCRPGFFAHGSNRLDIQRTKVIG